MLFLAFATPSKSPSCDLRTGFLTQGEMSSAPETRIQRLPAPAPASDCGSCLCFPSLGMLQQQGMRLEKRKSGSTGFTATVLGIGDLADRSVPVAKCVGTIHRAMEFGLNLIDTAPRSWRPSAEQPPDRGHRSCNNGIRLPAEPGGGVGSGMDP